MLGCFVIGEDKAFIIGTDKIKTISQLRDTIKAYKENVFKTFDANQLTLWKVDIPFDCENDKLKMLDNAFGTINIEKDLKGEKMLPGDEISKYLKNLPTSSIHILVQPPPPATTGKCLPMVYLSNKKFALSHILYFFI